MYCDYYYFALFIDDCWEFWLNGKQFLGQIHKTNIPHSVIDYLEANCPKFINFYKNKQYNINSTAKWIESPYYQQNIPEIGNSYSAKVYKIVTEKDNQRNKRVIHVHQDWGSTLWAEFDTIGEKEVEAFLTLTIFSKTHKKVKSVYDLDCFMHLKKSSKKMTIIGSIIGDVMGSVYEFDNIRTTEFDMFHPNCDFTDDTVLTIAVADCVLHNKDLAKTIWEYGRAYPNRGYGGRFYDWLQQNQPQPYGSFGNGSAMRVSAVGFAYDDMETVLEVAKQTAVVTHDHPEGVKGAQATAAAIFMARQGSTKQEMNNFLSQQFNYDLDFTLDAIRPTYEFDETCQGTVPQAIVAFLESIDFEHAIRLAISIGGDSDTIACITGGIAAAYYKQIPVAMIEFALKKLPAEFIEIINEFEAGRNGTRSK